MATIDSNIALGVKPLQIENPMNQYAAMSQIQNAQNQNALAQFQLSSAKRAEESQNALSDVYKNAYDPATGKVNNELIVKGLAERGAGHLIPKVQQDILAREKEAATLKKTNVETTGLEFKQRIEKANKAISDIAALTSPQDAIAGIDRHLANGDIDQVKADQLKQSIAQAPNFSAWRKTTLVNILDAKDNLEQQNREGQLKVSQGNLAVNQGQLAIAQNKANRENTIGTIPAGYRLLPDGKTLELMVGGPTAVTLPPKEIQKREAVYPAANQAIKTVEAKTKTLLEDIDLLKNHPGLNQMTGVVAGRLPVFTPEGAAAKAIYDRIVARGGFQELQDMRKASPTGGALGNVSNQEGQQLRDAWAAINRVQNAKDLKTQLERAANDVRGSTDRIREAFNETYDYKNGANATTAPIAPTPTNPASNGLSTNVTTPDGKVFTFPTPEAAALFKQKTGIQ